MTPVLIIDDSREDIALITRVFGQCKIRNPLVPMPAGEQCITYFEKAGARAAGALPCLVLLDLAMQPTSGIDVLKHLSASPQADTAGSVFVMLSGISDYNIVREGYQLGAATFLTKPLQCGDLLAMVRSVSGLTLHQTADGISVMTTHQGRGLAGDVRATC